MQTMTLHGFYENGKITFAEKKLPKGKAFVEVKLVPEKKANYINQLRKKIEKREI